MARFFMFSRIYFHPIRRIYDYHLGCFLQSWLQSIGRDSFPIEIDEFLRYDDSYIRRKIITAGREPSGAGHSHAKSLLERRHLVLCHHLSKSELDRNADALELIYEGIKRAYPSTRSYKDAEYVKQKLYTFPVQDLSGMVSSESLSDLLGHIPSLIGGYIFVERVRRDAVVRHIKVNKLRLITDEVEVIRNDEGR